MKRGILFTVSLLFLTVLSAQTNPLIPTGKWKYHLSYKNPKYCESTEQFIYASTTNGFWRTANNGEMELLLSSGGFHANEITCLEYNSELKILFIGYLDGHISLLVNDKKIKDISGFRDKFLQGDKRILDVSFHQNDALVSTNFGLLVVDLAKEEIRDSYTSIGEGGTATAVLSTAILNDSIFASTPTGFRIAPWNRLVNLNDYNLWQTRFPNIIAEQLCTFNNKIYFAFDSAVYFYNNGNIQPLNSNKNAIARIFKNSNGLHIVKPGGIENIDDNGQSIEPINLVVHATQFTDGVYWFCTGVGPGVIKKDPNGEIAYMPNGPDNQSVFKMSKGGETLVCTGGGLSSTFGNAYNTSGYYLFRDFQWNSNPHIPQIQNLYDFTFTAYSKWNQHYFISTHTGGILEIFNGIVVEHINHTNSTLKRIGDTSFIQIGGIAIDENGRLWVINYNAEKPLHMRDNSGNWNSFDLPYSNITSLTIDQNNNKWMTVASGGVLVFHEGESITSKGDDRQRFLTQNNGLNSNEVLSIAVDKNNYVWLGNLQGLNVFAGGDIFTQSKVDRYIIDQDGSVGYLMGEEIIQDILVDGGNRKWFATQNGLFCIDEYGQKVIRHFTPENSPLLSNFVKCLGQITSTGEIFIGTNKGIISYRNDAGEADNSFGKIVVYPNPVPPKYDGLITIEGLAFNAEIRITDLQGKVVFQGKANGSKATWDGLRLNGTRPNSGVYFVFAINQDGSETAMGKFIFIK